MIINYLKNIGYTALELLIITFIITILNYFRIINSNTLKILLTITIILSLFTGGYQIGKKANKKGFLEGIKYGSIISFIIFIFNLVIFKNKFTLLSILFYLTIIISSMIGGMIGVLRKKA